MRQAKSKAGQTVNAEKAEGTVPADDIVASGHGRYAEETKSRIPLTTRKKGRGRSTCAVKAVRVIPRPSDTSGSGRLAHAEKATTLVPLPEAIARLRRLIPDRQAVLKMQRAIRQPVLARIYTYLGGASKELFGEDSAPNRKAIWQKAEEVYDAAANPDKPYDAALAGVVELAWPLVAAHQRAVAPFDELRESIEEQCRELVSTMPAYDWWVAQRGCSALGFALIIGHTGDINAYRNEGCLYKRLGLGTFDGKCQNDVPEGAAAEVWIERGYSGVRRAAVHVVADAILKLQGKDSGERWREVYAARRAKCEADERFGVKDKNKGHYHLDALRYMSKKFIRALRKRWRLETGRAECAEKAVKVVPVSA